MLIWFLLIKPRWIWWYYSYNLKSEIRNIFFWILILPFQHCSIIIFLRRILPLTSFLLAFKSRWSSVINLSSYSLKNMTSIRSHPPIFNFWRSRYVKPKNYFTCVQSCFPFMIISYLVLIIKNISLLCFVQFFIIIFCGALGQQNKLSTSNHTAARWYHFKGVGGEPLDSYIYVISLSFLLTVVLSWLIYV